jgi:hypothetical protein
VLKCLSGCVFVWVCVALWVCVWVCGSGCVCLWLGLCARVRVGGCVGLSGCGVCVGGCVCVCVQ